MMVFPALECSWGRISNSFNQTVKDALEGHSVDWSVVVSDYKTFVGSLEQLSRQFLWSKEWKLSAKHLENAQVFKDLRFTYDGYILDVGPDSYRNRYKNAALMSSRFQTASRLIEEVLQLMGGQLLLFS